MGIGMGRGGRVEILAVAGLYVAGVLGAGFASGQELVVFFVNFGWAGFVGIFLTIAILTYSVVAVLELCHRQGVSSYENLFVHLQIRGALWFDLVYTAFLLVGVSVMLAGMGAMGGFVRLIGVILVFAVLQRGSASVLKISGPLAIVMVVVLVAMSLGQPQTEDLTLPNTGSWRGLEAAILYASYNVGFSMAVLASVHKVLKNSKQRWGVALVGNLILGTLLLLLYFRLSGLTAEQLTYDFPLENLATMRGPLMVKTYRLMLWVAMYTTALANSLSLVTRITQSGRFGWSFVSVVVLLIATGLSYFGFSTLVRIAYPLLGLAGLWLLSSLLVQRWIAPPKFQSH